MKAADVNVNPRLINGPLGRETLTYPSPAPPPVSCSLESRKACCCPVRVGMMRRHSTGQKKTSTLTVGILLGTVSQFPKGRRSFYERGEQPWLSASAGRCSNQNPGRYLRITTSPIRHNTVAALRYRQIPQSPCLDLDVNCPGLKTAARRSPALLPTPTPS